MKVLITGATGLLGGHLIKQRVARRGKGRSGGYWRSKRRRARSFCSGSPRARETASARRLESLKRIGAKWLAADPAFIERSIDEGVLVEMSRESQETEAQPRDRSHS